MGEKGSYVKARHMKLCLLGALLLGIGGAAATAALVDAAADCVDSAACADLAPLLTKVCGHDDIKAMCPKACGGELCTSTTLEESSNRSQTRQRRSTAVVDKRAGNVPHWTPFHDYFKTLDIRKTPAACQGCHLPLADKWESYFAAYHKHFARYRGKKVTFLEVGVQSGGSAAMWRWYFGSGLTYIGVDINPAVQMFQNDWSHIFVGSQTDRNFWKELKPKLHALGGIDIMLDDGGHTMAQQKVTFFEMFPRVKRDGIYACEDLGTSFWTGFGGHADPESTADFVGKTMLGLSMQWVNWLHSSFYAPREHADFIGKFQAETQSIHFYNQIVILEKTPGDKTPGSIMAGGEKTKIVPYNQLPWNGQTFPMTKAVEDITAALRSAPTRADGDHCGDDYWDAQPGKLDIDVQRLADLKEIERKRVALRKH